jgi:transposase
MRLRMSRHERERLDQLARSATDVRLLRRIQALLDLDAGDSAALVARRYQVTRATIYNWIKRCRTRGVSDEALRDLPRPGRPRIVQKGGGRNDGRQST